MLFPGIMVFSAVGIYSSSNVSFDIYLTALFGIVGIAWRLLECSPVPMLLGFVLGLMMEENLRRALQVSRGDPAVFVNEGGFDLDGGARQPRRPGVVAVLREPRGRCYRDLRHGDSAGGPARR